VTANATSFPIEETSIAAFHAGYLSGRATAVSVCQAHLDRIAAYDRKGRLALDALCTRPVSGRRGPQLYRELSVDWCA